MISLLVVNYRAARLAAEAVRTARIASRSPLQVVIVDNSCDPAEAGLLRPYADVLLVSPVNSGYAGGINSGRRACTGDAIVVTNPDVTFGPEAIDRLVGALDDVPVAGPALYWDDAHRWMLPPGQVHDAIEKLDEVLAGRSRRWQEALDRRRFLRRVHFWSLQRTTAVATLSGAVMAIRARELDDLEGFDERFPLYFEETDFLRRVRSRRMSIAYVPAARCRHIYDQSALQVAESAAARYAQSELRYLEKWNGPLLARTLVKLARPLRPAATEGEVRAEDLDRALRAVLQRSSRSVRDVVVEASPLASFATAAGHFPQESLSLPSEVLASVRGALYVRVVVRDGGTVLGTYKLTP